MKPTMYTATQRVTQGEANGWVWFLRLSTANGVGVILHEVATSSKVLIGSPYTTDTEIVVQRLTGAGGEYTTKTAYCVMPRDGFTNDACFSGATTGTAEDLFSSNCSPKRLFRHIFLPHERPTILPGVSEQVLRMGVWAHTASTMVVVHQLVFEVIH